MTKRMRTSFRWIARTLAFAMAGFVGVFALDAFSDGASIQAVGAFAIDLVPSALILVALGIAWRWPMAGGALFLLLAAGYGVNVGSRHIDWIAVIAGPLIVIGALFLSSAVAPRSTSPRS